MHPLCLGSSPQRGRSSRVEGGLVLQACIMAWPPPIALACVEMAVQHEVMAAGFPLRKAALFAQKIVTPSLSCSNAWPPGPFVAWYPLPSPTMTMLRTPPGPFVRAS